MKIVTQESSDQKLMETLGSDTMALKTKKHNQKRCNERKVFPMHITYSH
jgi:hypothetical protein